MLNNLTMGGPNLKNYSVHQPDDQSLNKQQIPTCIYPNAGKTIFCLQFHANESSNFSGAQIYPSTPCLRQIF